DALFIGFSPSIATGVWVGQDLFTTLGKGETGAKAALPIWIEFMGKTLLDKSIQYWDIPDTVITVPMNPSTGCRETGDSPHAVSALFKKGTEPRQSGCSKY
ncbi:MAG: penicillin-binding protein, partial [Deltaproteobacteria bacterium]|nr:penicillin-binding protein [Deltaproteobacteria bacterium]